MKIYLDNTFFTEYEACNDNKYREEIKNAFIRSRFSFYSSIELIDEMLGIAETGVSVKLRERLRLFLDIFPKRLLNYHGRIIQSEFGFRNDNIFLPAPEVSNIKTKIPYIIRGEVEQKYIIDYLDEVRGRKKEHGDYYKEVQSIIKVRTQKIRNINISFEQYLDNFPKEQLIIFIKRIIAKENIEDIDSKASLIANNLTDYKYFNNLFNIIVALHYKYFILNFRVDPSDYYDALHLVYLTGLDALFTNDQRMIWLCEIIFKKDKKVITFENIKNYL